jgi:cleavage stimulation factor subunit 3
MNSEVVEAEEEEEDKIARPDFSQMVPFKAKVDAYPGEHIIPGKVHSSCLDTL